MTPNDDNASINGVMSMIEEPRQIFWPKEA